MSTASPPLPECEDDFTPPGAPMSLSEFRALPDDPTLDRMLIRGRLWEKEMTRRNRWHARIESRIAQLLSNWLDEQPEPRGEVFSGEIGCDLPDSESGVGIDVAVVGPELLAGLDEKERYIIGAPILAVEILSPSDRNEEIHAKVGVYLAAGVPAVWIVDPKFETLVVHRANTPPQMCSGDDELSADPYLPGFAVPVAKLFRR